MVRAIAFLIRASCGGLSHECVMQLTWRQFETYQEAFRYVLRAESTKGQEENEMDDLKFYASHDELKEENKTELEIIKEKLKTHKERTTKGKRTKEQKLLQ